MKLSSISSGSDLFFKNPSIDFLIGNNIVVGDYYFDGLIDDISLWSITLNEEQIQSLWTLISFETWAQLFLDRDINNIV